MKVIDIFEARDEDWSISEDDMEMIFKVVHKRELDQNDIKGLAAEVADDEGFTRSPGSAAFIINRMHVLIHGVAPYGYSERSAEQMMRPAKPLIAFLKTKGYDGDENLRKARIELKTRKQKVKQEDATKMMSDYYKTVKDEFNSVQKKKLKSKRESIIKNIMAGNTPKEAMAAA